LVSFGEQHSLKEVMAAGAAGYVLKSAPIDHVARAIRTAAYDSTRGTPPSRAVTSSGDQSYSPSGPWLQNDVG
jgi:DNA-binding NarL/FixJ family response regulator